MTLNGIDISGWQPDIDLAAVPLDFVLIKATGGVGYVSPACERQYQQAKALGLRRGVYHFAREAGCAGSAEAEADFFIENTRGYHDGSTWLVLDWEGDNTPDVGWALRFLTRVLDKTGIRPVIYMSQSVVNAHDWSPVVAGDFGLWLAQYPFPNETDGYAIPAGPPPVNHWPFVAMWQYTSGGKLPGYGGRLDLNVFFGDGAAWDRYAAKVGELPAAPIVVVPESVPAPAPAPAPAPPAVGVGECIVEAGDTLGSIAAQFGTSWQAIAALNGLANPDLIHPGQVLKLPGSGAAPAPSSPAECIVEAGDTLSGIGAQFGVPWQRIAALNGLTDPNTIYPGQVLRLR